MESSIFIALIIISRDKHNKFIIFSDSLSVLTSMENKKLENPLIVKLLSRLDSMSSHKKNNFVLDSRPHRSERKRKSRLSSQIGLRSKSSIPYTDLKPIISKFLHRKWHQRWNMNINNKLFQIQPTLEEWRPAFRVSRREQVVLFRLRIGHTRLTHVFKLKQEPQSQRLTCQTTCTVKHILIECRAFAIIRKQFFKVTSLTELFENIKIDDVLSFLRETGLYEKI